MLYNMRIIYIACHYACQHTIFEDGMGIQAGGRKDGQTEGEELSDPDILICCAIQ